MNFKKLDTPMLADELLSDRTPETPLVMVRSHGPHSHGYWGRSHSVKSAIRAAAWIGVGETVLVFLCNRDTSVSQIDGAVRSSSIGQIYKGRVTKDKDVKVTHRQLKEDKPTPEQAAAVRRFAHEYGGSWKAGLHLCWMNASYPRSPEADRPLLQQVRNQFGPLWLEGVTLDQLKED